VRIRYSLSFAEGLLDASETEDESESTVMRRLESGFEIGIATETGVCSDEEDRVVAVLVEAAVEAVV